VASRKAAVTSKAAAVEAWLRRLTAVTEGGWLALRAAFPDASLPMLRKAVRQSGLPMAPMVEGVRQDSFEELARTLRALQMEYESAETAQDRGRMRALRERVIEAKTHARFAARRAKEMPSNTREEMIEWMLVWLNDPKLFGGWAKLALARKHSLRGDSVAGQVSHPDAGQADDDG
jgi:hypothetical protein